MNKTLTCDFTHKECSDTCKCESCIDNRYEQMKVGFAKKALVILFVLGLAVLVKLL